MKIPIPPKNSAEVFERGKIRCEIESLIFFEDVWELRTIVP